jgi:hypothetical protein
MVWPVRWQDATLTPHVLRLVPDGYVHVDKLDVARALGVAAFDILPRVRAAHFRELWDITLDLGWQPNGLLLVHLSRLPKPEGHATGITAARFSTFCQRQRLWQNVPGRLHPRPNSDVPSERHRAYLIIAPLPDPGARR